MKKVLIVGTCTQDRIFGKSYFGGAAGGIALNLGALGIPVGLLSVLGSDAFSNKYNKELKKKNVNLNFVTHAKVHIPILTVKSKENSENSRIFKDNGIYNVLENLEPNIHKLFAYDFIHVVNTPKKLADYLAETFKGEVSYCPGSLLVRDKQSLSKKLLERATYICANHDEYKILKPVIKFKDKFKAIIVTNADKKIQIITTKNIKNISVPTTLTVDTTGAGDALVVGFIEKLYEGLSWESAIEGGVFRAGESVKKKGVVFTK